MTAFELEVSHAYASWLETRIGHYLDERERKEAVLIEADRLQLEKKPAQSSEILTRITKRKHMTQQIRSLLTQHTQCLKFAKLGKLCDEDALTVGEDDAYTWTCGRLKDENAPRSSAKDIYAALPKIVGRERWERQALPVDDPDFEEDRVESRLHRVDPPRRCDLEEYWRDQLDAMEPLRRSLTQDQLRSWMGVIRRKLYSEDAREKGEGFALFLPVELFQHVSAFLEPFGLVLLSATYYARTALHRRFRDVEKTLDAAWRNYLGEFMDNHGPGSESASQLLIPCHDSQQSQWLHWMETRRRE
ncbi:unnamed protein product [Amoebophrya sp. A120]|nr:unnamed protein product [Amoebophrya sp. A120]|eukprot:GSA120T00003149001.1